MHVSRRFICVFVLFPATSGRCSWNRSPSRLPVSLMYNRLPRVQIMQYIGCCRLNYQCLCPHIFSSLRMKHVLHRVRAPLIVPG